MGSFLPSGELSLERAGSGLSRSAVRIRPHKPVLAGGTPWIWGFGSESAFFDEGFERGGKFENRHVFFMFYHRIFLARVPEAAIEGTAPIV